VCATAPKREWSGGGVIPVDKNQGERMMLHNFTQVPDDMRYDLKACEMVQALGAGVLSVGHEIK
jgi:hypothetical protein